MAAACGVFVALLTWWWEAPYLASPALQTSGDPAWISAMVQSAMQSGPFGTTMHAGWPEGFNPWQYPTGGSVAFLTGAWLFGLVGTGVGTALTLLMAATAAANTVASFFAIRWAAAGRTHAAVCAVFSIAVGASPFVLSKVGHYNVAAFYLLPATIAVTAYLIRSNTARARWIALAALAVITLLSPLWWIFIVAFFIVLGLLVAALLRSREWLVRTALVGAFVAIGAAIPVALALINHIPGSSTGREVWDSIIYGGSLTDFLVSSTFLRTHIPRIAELVPAASHELSVVGTIPALTGIAAVLIAMTAYLGYRRERLGHVGWLLVLLQLSLLAFLTKGLGTLQEALLFAVGVESPLRGWSRLIILIALIGMILVAPSVSSALGHWKGTVGRVIVVAFVIAGIGLVVLDAKTLPRPTGTPSGSVAEAAAVDYLKQTRPDCPVVQLPVQTFPDFPLSSTRADFIDYYYRGFVPYLLNPDGTWSFGSMQATAGDTALRALPTTLDAAQLTALHDMGFCAVLFDRDYAAWTKGSGKPWPAQETAGISPEWSDARFDVFALDGPTPAS